MSSSFGGLKAPRREEEPQTSPFPPNQLAQRNFPNRSESEPVSSAQIRQKKADVIALSLKTCGIIWDYISCRLHKREKQDLKAAAADQSPVASGSVQMGFFCLELHITHHLLV